MPIRRHAICYEALKVYYNVFPAAHLARVNYILGAGDPFTSGSARQRHEPPPERIAAFMREIEGFRQIEQMECSRARHSALRMFGRVPGDTPFQTMRIVDAGRPEHSHCRHFDSHLLTFLIPLQLAEPTFFNGDLVMYHKIRSSVSTATNLMFKLSHGVQRNLPFSLRKALLKRDLDAGRCMRVHCEPGNVYVFNGFLTQHCNLDVEKGERRSLLIHYFDPGLCAGLSAVTRTIRTAGDRLRTRDIDGVSS